MRRTCTKIMDDEKKRKINKKIRRKPKKSRKIKNMCAGKITESGRGREEETGTILSSVKCNKDARDYLIILTVSACNLT